MISQKKVLCNRLLRNCSKKVIDVLKLNRTLQNILYCYVIIVINYNTNNIHILYQSRLQDKPIFFLCRICKNLRKISGGSQPPNTSSSCATDYIDCPSHRWKSEGTWEGLNPPTQSRNFVRNIIRCFYNYLLVVLKIVK
jgi:hypothetical protein